MPAGAEPSMVSILPPHVVHDGRPATTRGFRKRVLYLEPGVIGEDLIGAAVDRPILTGPSLRREVSALHDLLGCIDDSIEAEVRLGFVVERIRESLGSVGPMPLPRRKAGSTGPDLAEQLRAYLDAHLHESVTMAAAAETLGAGSTQLARAFTSTFGIAPHAYVMGCRLDAARDRILEGQPLADVAADVGFFDQAHLSRRFRRYLGTTPGRFAGSGAPWREILAGRSD